MSEQSSTKTEASPEKEITEIKKLKTDEISAELDKFHLLIETLLNEVEKEEHKSDLNSTDGFVDILGSVGKEMIERFQVEIEKLDIPEGSKTALKTPSKFVYVLTNKKFKKVE